MNQKIFYAIYAALVLLIFVIAMDTFNVRGSLEQTRFKSIKEAEAQAPDQNQDSQAIEIPIRSIEGRSYVNLEILARSLEGVADIDHKEGTASYRALGLLMKWVKDTPMIEKNGLYLPNEQKTLFEEDGVWIPASVLKELNEEVVFVPEPPS